MVELTDEQQKRIWELVIQIKCEAFNAGCHWVKRGKKHRILWGRFNDECNLYIKKLFAEFGVDLDDPTEAAIATSFVAKTSF